MTDKEQPTLADEFERFANVITPTPWTYHYHSGRDSEGNYYEPPEAWVTSPDGTCVFVWYGEYDGRMGEPSDQRFAAATEEPVYGNRAIENTRYNLHDHSADAICDAICDIIAEPDPEETV